MYVILLPLAITCHLDISVAGIYLLIICLILAVQSLTHVQLFVIPWTKHARLPCSSLSPGISSNSSPLSQWCFLSISSTAAHFSSWPQSFPASGSFPLGQLFSSGSQSIGASASASVLPVNIQGWFPLGLTGVISLLSKGLSRVFCSPTFTSVHDYWKNHSFDYADLCQQCDVAFQYAV